jgi:predicted  nucleic acid-binding Zn-ribbon protein
MSDVMKVRNDIRDLESKKETLLKANQTDIDSINKKMLTTYCQIGQKAYEMSQAGNDSMGELQENFAQITEFKAEINTKNDKLKSIAARYDEEIELLQKLIPEAPPAGSKEFCMNCGTGYVPGVDTFCAGCGSKLAAAAPPAGAGFAGPPKCSGCGTPFKPGVDAFCMGCGKSLK